MTKKFIEFLDSCDNPDLDEFVDQVDQSDYALLDWIEALLGFGDWLKARNHQSFPFREMVGYTHCCTLTNAPGISLPSLKLVVVQALEEHGFAAATDS
ncbi:MAG: hypothetical protein AAGA96_00480 [Verrucomicrobiota bacterium]